MSTGLPPFASGDMDYAGRPDVAQVTEPAGDLPGTGATTVASGAGPDIGVSDLGETVQADALAASSSGCTQVDSALPESVRGPIERADDLLSNSPASGDRRQGTY